MKKWMVIDVESNGLHGEGFAVGYVVIDEIGTIHDEGYCRCLMAPEDLDPWVRDNVWPNVDSHQGHKVVSAKSLRSWFWQKWRHWKVEHEVTLAADCQWPVEARFLSACIDDHPDFRAWDGPYPFVEISDYLEMAGLDPKGTYPRRDNELPVHHALSDARQSARLFIEARNTVRAHSRMGQIFGAGEGWIL